VGGAKQFAQPSSSTSSSSSSTLLSSPAIPSLSWPRSSNPFLPSKNQSGRNVKPLYSLRRQKMLHRAFERITTASNFTSTSASPSEYILPPGSPKASSSSRQQQKDSATSHRLHKLKDASSKPRNTNTTPSPVKVPSTGNAKMRQAMQSGPYKGRSVVFKGHKWEREAESVRAEREEKIKGMPARIAEYTKVRRNLR